MHSPACTQVGMEPWAWGDTWPQIHPSSVMWVWVRWEPPFLRKNGLTKAQHCHPPLWHSQQFAQLRPHPSPTFCHGEEPKHGRNEQVLARESPQKELSKGETQSQHSDQHRAGECLLAHGKADICGWGPAGMSSLLGCDQRGLSAPCSFSKASERCWIRSTSHISAPRGRSARSPRLGCRQINVQLFSMGDAVCGQGEQLTLLWKGTRE